MFRGLDPQRYQVIKQRDSAMFKRKAELIDQKGVVLATFNETCHDYGTTVATVKLRAPLAPFTLEGTENLAIFAKGISQPVISVEASDPAGTEIFEFHWKQVQSAVYRTVRGSRW
jgi:hypothetical protein